MIVYLQGQSIEIKLPDRATIVAIRAKYRLILADNPVKVVDGKVEMPATEKISDYHEAIKTYAYETADRCGYRHNDPVIQEKVGEQILDYMLKGPEATRPVTIDELNRMIGALVLSDGPWKNKLDEIRKLAEILRQQLLSAGTGLLAEGDKKADPTR